MAVDQLLARIDERHGAGWRLRGLGAPVPTYPLAGACPGNYTCRLQTALPGAPPAAPPDRRGL
jgi:hypothetical protein